MTEGTLTLERMRADVAELLEERPEAIEVGVSLLDLGLDSLRIMELAERWSRRTGTVVDFASLAEEPELGAWWKLVSDRTG